jgi:Family of unknown function (DUF5771)
MHKDMRSAHVRHLTAKRVSVKGTPSRPGYTYVRKAKTVRVRGVSAYDVGTIGKPKSVIGPLKHGMLTKFGYHPVEARSGRHKALMKAIHKGGEKPLAVFRRLQAVSILTKRMAPRASRIYKEDAKWVRVKYASNFKTPLK